VHGWGFFTITLDVGKGINQLFGGEVIELLKVTFEAWRDLTPVSIFPTIPNARLEMNKKEESRYSFKPAMIKAPKHIKPKYRGLRDDNTPASDPPPLPAQLAAAAAEVAKKKEKAPAPEVHPMINDATSKKIVKSPEQSATVTSASPSNASGANSVAALTSVESFVISQY